MSEPTTQSWVMNKSAEILTFMIGMWFPQVGFGM